MPGYQQMEVHMAHSKKEISMVSAIIDRVRTIRGESVIPKEVCPEVALDTIRLIQRKRSDLFQAGEKPGLRLLTKEVSEDRIFTLDERVNTVLGYAYQVVAMNYFGDKRKENQQLFRMHRKSFASIESNE